MRSPGAYTKVVVLTGKTNRRERRYLFLSRLHKIPASELRAIGRRWDVSGVPPEYVDWGTDDREPDGD